MKSNRPFLPSIIYLHLRGGFPHTSSAAETSDLSFGFSSCPCRQVNNVSLATSFNISAEGAEILGEELASDPLFGMNRCKKHDENSTICQEKIKDNSNLFAPPVKKEDRSYCEREWCFVDPDNCDLTKSPSVYFPDQNKFFSYATCGEVDAFAGTRLIEVVKKQVLKVGLNHNSGGWVGAYSKNKKHFEGPWSSWSGATVDLVRAAATNHGFQLNITDDLPFDDFFLGDNYGSGDAFLNRCIHATALGYLDMCIGQYTITTKRAAAADFVRVTSEPVFMLLSKNNTEQKKGLAEYIDAARTVFSPFHWTTWLFTMFFVMPVIGMISFVHHYDTDFFPKSKTRTVEDENGEETQVEKRIPFLKHFFSVTYENIIGTLQGTSFERSSNAGSMISNIGVSFFVVVIIATYTANLASFFTVRAPTRTVNNVEEAIEAGYRFCVLRTRLEVFRGLYKQLPDERFVVDPEELGGDGKPGFICPKCNARTRTLERLDPVRANNDKTYCHAAISVMGELETEQAKSRFCDLFATGPAIYTINSGIPVAAKKFTVLTALFHKLSNDGVFERIMKDNRLSSTCFNENAGNLQNNLKSLTIRDLVGLWSLVFSFGFIGVMVTMFTPPKKGMKSRISGVKKYVKEQRRSLLS